MGENGKIFLLAATVAFSLWLWKTNSNAQVLTFSLNFFFSP